MFNRNKVKFLTAVTAISSAIAFSIAACGKKEEAPKAPAVPVVQVTPEQLEQQRKEIVARAQAEAEARAARNAEEEKQRAIDDAAYEKQRAIDEAEEAKRQVAQAAEDKIMRTAASKVLDGENTKLKAKLAKAQNDPQSLDKRGRVYFNADDNTGTIYTAPRTIELYNRNKPTWDVKEDDKGVNRLDPESVSDNVDHTYSVGTIYRPGKAFHVDLNSGNVCAAQVPETQTISPSDSEENADQNDDQSSVSDNFVEPGEDCSTIKQFTAEDGALAPDIRLLQNAVRAKTAKLAPAPK